MTGSMRSRYSHAMIFSGTVIPRSDHSRISFSVRRRCTSTWRAIVVLERIAFADANAFRAGSLSWLTRTTACVLLGRIIPAAFGASCRDTFL